MVETSIVFDGEVSDRSLDRSARKVEDRFSEAGEIRPTVDERELQRNLPDNVSVGVSPGEMGGGGGGGMSVFETASLGLSERTLKWQKESAQEDTERNRMLKAAGKELAEIRQRIPALTEGDAPALGGETIDMGEGDGTGALEIAGMGSLASRIPKPIAGVAAGAAIPAALVGGVGVGMLSAMHSASNRLQTSTSLLGQAWNQLWRPMGDSLDQLFVRDAVLDVVSATTEFENTWNSEQEFAAIVGLERDMLGFLSDITDGIPLIGPVFDMSEAFAGAVESFLEGRISVPEFSWPSLPTFTWPDIPTPDVSFDVSTSIDIRGTIEDFLDGRGIVDTVVDEAEAVLDRGGFDEPTGPGDGVDLETGFPGLQRGGRVTRTGVAEVHRGELVADPDRLVSELSAAIRQSGGDGATVDMGSVERKLDDVNRNLKRLAQAMGSMGVSVDGQTFGQVVADTQDGNVLDVDPTV